MKRFKILSVTSSIALLCAGVLGPAAHAAAAGDERPTALKFRYTGETCSAWVNQQGSDASCIDHSLQRSSEVRIVASDPQDSKRIWYDGMVQANKEFAIDALNGERTSFTGDAIAFSIRDPQGRMLQSIRIGIADAGALGKEAVFGALTLRKVDYKFKVPKNYQDFTQYIVSFNDEVSWKEIEAYAKYWKTYGVGIGMELPLINALALKVPDYVMPEQLAADPRVAAVEYNQALGSAESLTAQGQSFIRPLAKQPDKDEYPWSVLKLYDQPYAYPSTDVPLGRLDKDVVPEVIQLAFKELNNAHLRVAFFDTGIEMRHKDAASKVKGGVGIVSEILDKRKETTFVKGAMADDNGHGTHVAGILAAALDEKYKWGHDAKIDLYAIKVLDRYATGALSNIILGLQWAVDNDIDILNLSLGYHRDSVATRRAIREAAKAGLIMVASVGNHSNYDESAVLGGLSRNGAAEGGAAEGGAAEGGAAEGGAAEGGAAEGGAAEGGAAEGGAAEGGAAEGGAAEGGAAEGGAAEGGAAEGGAAEGGAAEGGAAEGGAAEGGAAEGGAANLVQVYSARPLPLFSVMYPARYPEVIAVGASTPAGKLAPFSNAGQEMDLMAPGVDILSADITNGHPEDGIGSSSGTSMATPYVTAAVSMMLALDPTLDVFEIRDILKQTAHHRDGMSFGDLNLSGALNEVIRRLGIPDADALGKKALEKQYREQLKAKLAHAGG